MKYGYFDDAQAEYVITTPRTPVKWINYVGTLAFGGFVDSTGGGLLCKGDPALNRIVKYISQMPASDFKGQTLYVRRRDVSGGASRLIAPFFVPALAQPDKWECRIGLGYTRFLSSWDGLDFDIRVFCPPEDSAHPLAANREIRDIRVTNHTGKSVELDFIPVVEYTHFDALKQLTNADWVPQTMQSRALRESDGFVTLCQCAFMRKGVAENYFTANAPVSSFETDRKRFLGDNEYGTWAHPRALDEAELSNYEARRGDNIAALLCRAGVLAAGGSFRLITQLGQEAEPENGEVRAEARRWRDPAVVDRAFAVLAAFWKNYLSACAFESPDPAFNSMMNIHNPRQCRITRIWSRYLSLYQLGFGSDRGIGFRDTSQDIMGIVSHDSDSARTLAAQLLSVQRRDGSAMHQFNPLTMVGTAGDSHEYPDRPSFYSDDHLWIVLAVTAYLRETGDTAFLDEKIPFYEKDREGHALEQGSVFEHLCRALSFTASHCGAHGLPLLGFADWNDTVNLSTGAESLFTANLYGRALRDMIELAAYRERQLPTGQNESADGQNSRDYIEDWELCYALMSARVNENAWDGQWYVRYFTAEGEAIGSAKSEFGKIWVNSQSWAVLSGFAADAGRERLCMDAVFTRLNTVNGIKLSAPSYNGYDRERGGVSTYPPGAKENGGIFLHTNPWAIIAECLNGNGERAWQYYCQINPAVRNDRLDEFECEPFVYPQNMLGDEHPQCGLGRNSWLSGTASWVYQAASQYIAGIRAGYDSLIIDPCIPRSWKTLRVRRRFRGVSYDISIDNSGSVNRGVRSITFDGEALPVCREGKSHAYARVSLLSGAATGAGDVAAVRAGGTVHKIIVVLGN